MGKIRCTIDPKILPKTRIFHEVDEMSVRPATPEPSEPPVIGLTRMTL